MANQYTKTPADALRDKQIAEATRTDSVYNVAVRFGMKENQVRWRMKINGIRRVKDNVKIERRPAKTGIFDVYAEKNWLVNDGYTR